MFVGDIVPAREKTGEGLHGPRGVHGVHSYGVGHGTEDRVLPTKGERSGRLEDL